MSMGHRQDHGTQPQLRSNGKVSPKDGKVDLWCKWKHGGWTLVAKESDESDETVVIDVPKGEKPCRVIIRIKSGSSHLKLHPTTPMWAQDGSCPTSQPSGGPIATKEISDVRRNSDTQLSFTDQNSTAGTVGYAIVFDDGSCFDPDIKNGGPD